MSIRVKEMDKHELLKFILLNEYNIKEYELIYNKNGKPFIKNSSIHFNLSTSNGLSVVATCKNNDVGVCIRHFFYDEKIIEEYFNDNEKNIIENSKNKIEEFTKIYTTKIAYVKMLGESKNYPINTIDTTELNASEYRVTKDYLVSVVYSGR